MLALTPAWLEWYRLQHRDACNQTGDAFEQYVESVLRHLHPDFLNPTPTGSLGDGGSDGLAEAGRICYACFGYRPMRDAEDKLAAKIEADFLRAYASWPTFAVWRFVTNTRPGPKATAALVALQAQHGEAPQRPVEVRLWQTDDIWDHALNLLSMDVLNSIFPGAPGAAHLELEDLIPLLDSLDGAAISEVDRASIRPVPEDKLDYNGLSDKVKIEFNEGRLIGPQIEKWFNANSDPNLRDRQADRFRRIYQDHREVTTDPAALLERVYVSLGGSDFRLDTKRANAVYAVTAFFFDACDIFEEPPQTVWE